MDMKDLRSRIDSIKDNNSASPTAPKPRRPDSGLALLENGWEKIDDMVYKKVTVKKNILPKTVSNILLSENAADITSASDLIFYDTETTGLSAGAGNIVFLAGFGFAIDEGIFKTVQLFLSDFPGEPAFLNQMKCFINPDKIYVSYNGKSFDSSILRSRYAMHGQQVDFGYQLDLLYSSRRLWKNVIGSCSLGDIEREVLYKQRTLDVPGFMVPDLYFDFLRDGRWDTIEAVIAHHLEDISSLAELLTIQENLFNKVSPDVRIDQLGLSSLLASKRPEAAACILKNSFEDGNHKAGMVLSLQYKRAGQWANAAALWFRMWEERHSIFAGVELAKYLEHQVRDIPAALKITTEMLELEHFRIISILPELDKRRKRLYEKKRKAG